MTNGRPIHRLNYQVYILIDQWKASMTSFFIGTIKSVTICPTLILLLNALIAAPLAFRGYVFEGNMEVKKNRLKTSKDSNRKIQLPKTIPGPMCSFFIIEIPIV